jgi:prephenate dehydrogenase
MGKARRRLGLIGYGAFGRLIYPYLARDFEVRIFDPNLNATISSTSPSVTLDEAAKSDVVVIAAPVQAIKAIAREIAPTLQSGTLVLDVGSVKVLPAEVLKTELPSVVDIICTHPLFGPQSAAAGLGGLKIVLCPIRGRRLGATRAWLEALSLEVIVTTPELHDQDMAITQGITHLIAKVLAQMGPLPKELTTPSFELLVRAAEMVRYDTANVFRAIEHDNPYAIIVRKRFFALADSLSSELERSDPESLRRDCNRGLSEGDGHRLGGSSASYLRDDVY